MTLIEADFEVAEVRISVSHDLVKSVDPDTDAVVETEVVQLDRENEQHAVIDGLVNLVRMVGYTCNGQWSLNYQYFNIIIIYLYPGVCLGQASS